ncbi:type III-B CRISPR module RAMP protein Cmr1 [Dethiobacter alkaliphilus]|uniref:type III-B CRISPR module RAMP protein Cmr1 n=1 Tax=Dethiobacter alkaliphilus TaxID=427926 RepID=UPI00222777B9|nr:type III-B CRISPR module RAMP protein Cmr1 [Dethiobacter alkaliphilus]MCW3488688.1 type III-B CRISPR module RAMP protein Cmr1 [Dethiobacter alkaliphilus]
MKSFKCKVITPMFLTGVDGRTPEMRPPSLKGVLRYWWRAVKAMDNVSNMRETENKLFGGAGKGEGRSKITVRAGYKQFCTEKVQPLPHHKGDKKAYKSPAIVAGETFSITFSGQEAINSELEELFYLVSVLGGLGKRSRRGFGSFALDGREANSEAVVAALDKMAPGKYRLDGNEINATDTSAAADYPYIRNIAFGKGYGSYYRLLQHIGEGTHKYCDDALGYSNRNKRLASPVCVSVVYRNNQYYPVVTILNTVTGGAPLNHLKPQEDFKTWVLS